MQSLEVGSFIVLIPDPGIWGLCLKSRRKFTGTELTRRLDEGPRTDRTFSETRNITAWKTQFLQLSTQ